jgi:hypothetical protein
MKNTLLLVAAIGSFLLAGCASLQNSLFRPNRQTNAVPEKSVTLLVTNFYPQLVTNTVTQWVTNTVESQPVVREVERLVVVTNTVPFVLTNTVVIPATVAVSTNSWSVSPVVDTTLGVASLFGPQGALAGTLASGALNLWLLWMNKRQKKTNDVQEDTAVTIMQSVEQIRIVLRTTEQGRKLDDSVIKPLLEQGKLGAGADIIQNIERLINERTPHTGNMVKAFEAVSSVTAPATPLSPPIFSTANGRTIGELRSIWAGYAPRPADLLPGELELFARWTADKDVPSRG